jgi:hypothetical protein
MLTVFVLKGNNNEQGQQQQHEQGQEGWQCASEGRDDCVNEVVM